MLRLVLDGRFSLGPQLDHLLLGIDDHFVREPGFEMNCLDVAAAQRRQDEE